MWLPYISTFHLGWMSSLLSNGQHPLHVLKEFPLRIDLFLRSPQLPWTQENQQHFLSSWLFRGGVLQTAFLSALTHVPSVETTRNFKMTIPPTATALDLNAIGEGLQLAARLLAADPKTYQSASIFRDSAEALRYLIGPPRRHSVVLNYKRSCATLRL